ncbi:MAG: peptidase domain-containing ABC transporter [Dysgonamonadaceae bacterium]|jgi:ATP-binding cassette subfamily B protein|nr:peptidase domain-containing ABC transporter [Dysgonamonadaceae bacterium]
MKFNICKKLFVRQHGEFACGLACLSMIIRYYDGNIRQEKIRSISGTTTQGTTLLGLYQAAEKLHLIPEAYEADMESLKTIGVPVILHVIKEQRMEHYVVCFGLENKKFIIGDPEEHQIVYWTEQELESVWKSKVLLKLKPASDFVRQKSEKKEKRQWLKSIIHKDMPVLITAFVLGVIIAVLGLATAVFSQKLIDDLLPSKNYEKIMLSIALFFILVLARSGLGFLRSVFMLRQTKDMNNRLIDHFFSKILYLPKSFFDSTKTGEIITRMNDSRRIQQTLSYIVGSVLIDILALLFSIGYLLIYSWKMAVIASACIPFFALLVILYNRKIIDGQRNVMVSNAATEGLLIDFIQGVNDIKIANRQPVFKQSIQTMYGLYQQFGYKLGTIGLQYGLIAQVISAITSISLIVIGVSDVLSGELKLGELMAIITIGGMIISSTASLSGVNIRLQEAGIALERFFEFLRAEPEFEPEKKANGERVQDIKVHGVREEENAHLQINNLSFRFTGRKRLFENLSLEVRKGEIASLFGEVGSGKSTLIQILQKHYLSESGEILFNGAPLSGYSTPQWREYIGVVSQHTKIFNGNVFENICLGNYIDEIDSITSFCREYGFETFFDAFPQGLDTLLGEDGVKISGGQQQLIALARALYRQPSLLLLDEPTSAMDVKTEQFVVDLLKKHKKCYATLLVTHRTHLAGISDRVYRLENSSTTPLFS